jgi:hypothetical protein
MAFDYTLRYVYNALSKRRKCIMAIEFKHRGRTWRADTVEEAIALRNRLEGEDRAAIEDGEEPDEISEQVWTPDNVMDLLRGIGIQQKLFLKVLFENGTVTSDAVMEKLRLGSDLVLAGVLSGLSKQLKKLGVKPWDLYTTKVEWTGSKKTRSFGLANGFHWVASTLGWPEKWV